MIRNFFNTLRRFQMSSALNILGLSVAFAAFMLIMVQVKWDTTYETCYADADRIYRIELCDMKDKATPTDWNTPLSRPLGEMLGGVSPKIEAFGTFAYTGGVDLFYSIKAGNSPDTKLRFNKISPSLLDVLELKLVDGDFKAFKENPGHAIMSAQQARDLFGDKRAVGRQLYSQYDTTTIAAVFEDLPRNTFFYSRGVIYNYGREGENNYSNWSYPFYVKLRSASDQAAVETAMTKALQEKSNSKFKLRLQPIRKMQTATDMARGVQVGANPAVTTLLIAIACLILGIAVINFINFFVALVPVRIRSINISKIFGASTGTLRAMLIFEATAMMFISAIIGVCLVWMCSETPITEYISDSIGFPAIWPLVWGTLGLSVVMGLIAGVFPAIYITSFPAVIVLRGAFGRSRAGQRLRLGLVSVQYLISVTMIICALFVNIQTAFLENHDMGYNRENIIVAYVGNKIGANTKVLLDKVKSNPSIIDVAFADNQLVNTNQMGWGRMYKGEKISFDCFLVSSNFPKFMGMKVLEGRDFVPEDNNKPGTYLFNQVAKRKYGFAPGDQLGGHDTVDATVAGIVKDFVFNSLQYKIEPMGLYVMGGNNKWRNMRHAYFRVAAGTDLAETRKYLEKTILELNPNLVEVEIETFDDNMNKIYDKENKLTGMITWFSGLAIIISLMGVFGLVLFETQYRRKEIGVRRIHGSSVTQILMMFNRRFVWIVAGSFAVAVPLCVWGVNWWLSGFAYHTPLYWWVFPIGGLAIFAITVVTVTVQSYRSATENPVKCLKTE